MSYRNPDREPSFVEDWLQASPADRFDRAQPLLMLAGCIGLIVALLALMTLTAFYCGPPGRC